MANFSENGVRSDPIPGKQIVVLYEDSAAYAQAAQSAPELAQSNTPGTGIVHGWSFAAFSDKQRAAEAALHALTAHIVVFVASSTGDFPQELKLWIEGWVTQRGDREGAIVGLVSNPAAPGEIASLKEIYLRQVARRAGMDYCSQIPSGPPRIMPDSIDWYGERARQVTSVLDEILRSGPPPSLPNS
jgi:hypothetical protein